MRLACVLLCLALSPGVATAGVPEGLAAVERGDFETAYREFAALAETGDARAMVTIGLWFQDGQGFPRDYTKAMDWYLRAFELGDGDATNNLGVMYRDGQGVAVNRQIAYLLFLIVHMEGLGTASTQTRANRNLRREVAELPPEQIAQALCWTPAYLISVVRGRGTPDTPIAELSRSRKRPAFRDLDWWLDSELAGLPSCESAP